MDILNYIILFFKEFWYMSSSIASYMFIGFFIAGFINLFLSVDLIKKHIGKNSFNSIIKAAFFGIPIPLCSCSILPVASSLKKMGASNPAVLAFLIITPVTGIESIYLTWQVLGLSFALSRLTIVFFIGLIAGLISLLLKDKNEYNANIDTISSCENCNKSACSNLGEDNKSKSFYKFIQYSLYELPKSLSPSLVYGIAISAVLAIVLPKFSFYKNDLLGIVSATLLSIPIYVCASSSVPIALTMYLNGFSFSAVLAFLIAGPSTNFVSILTVKKILGSKNLKIFLISIFTITIAASLIINFFDLSILGQVSKTTKHHNSFNRIISILFLSLIMVYYIMHIMNLLKIRYKKK